jgi:hypothetical protein
VNLSKRELFVRAEEEGGSRLLEARWPLHHVQQMLGHANHSVPYFTASNL